MDGQRDWSLRLAIPLTCIFTSILAGLLAWSVGIVAGDPFHPRLFPVQADGYIAMDPSVGSLLDAERKNVAFAWATLAGATGIGMGLAGGIVARNATRGLVVGLFAQAGGVVVGVVAANAAIPVWQSLIPTRSQDMILPLLIHAAIALPVGALGGMAFAVGSGRYRRSPEIVLGAILGAVLATVLFELAGAMLPVDAGAPLPVARWRSVRLAAILLPTVLIGTGAAIGALRNGPRDTKED